MRRALLASLAVVVVVVADYGWRMLDERWPFFMAYALMIWAVLPVLLTLTVTFVVTLLSDVELPLWAPATLAALATGSWTAWAVGLDSGGAAYGLVLALGIVAVTLVMGASRPWWWRALLTALVAAATAAAVVVVLSG
jgi:hypothetical protein